MADIDAERSPSPTGEHVLAVELELCLLQQQGPAEQARRDLEVHLQVQRQLLRSRVARLTADGRAYTVDYRDEATDTPTGTRVTLRAVVALTDPLAAGIGEYVAATALPAAATAADGELTYDGRRFAYEPRWNIWRRIE